MMKKRLWSLVLTLAMVLSFFPGMTVTANAEEEAAVAQWVTVDAGAVEPAGGWSEPVTLTAAFAAANGAEANEVTYVKLNNKVEISGNSLEYVGLTLDAGKTMVLDLGEAKDNDTVELAISGEWRAVSRGIQVNGDLTVKNGDMTFTNPSTATTCSIYGIDVGTNGKLTVDNCDIVVTTTVGTAQGIVYNDADGTPNITVSNSTIDVDGKMAAYGINLFANAAVLRLSNTSLTVKTEGTESYGVSCTNRYSDDCQIYLSGDTTISGAKVGIEVNQAFNGVKIYAHDGNGTALNAAPEGKYIVINGTHINGTFGSDGFGSTVVYGVTEANAGNFKPTDAAAEYCVFGIKTDNLATTKPADPNEVKTVTITVDKSKLKKDVIINTSGAASFAPAEYFKNAKATWAIYLDDRWKDFPDTSYWTAVGISDDATVGLYLVGELMDDYYFPDSPSTSSVSVTVEGYQIESVGFISNYKVYGYIPLGTRAQVLAELESSSNEPIPPAGNGHSNHCVCGEANCLEHGGVKDNWIGVGDGVDDEEGVVTLKEMQEGGHYYLTENVEITEKQYKEKWSGWDAPNNSVLCLNGYVVTFSSEINTDNYYKYIEVNGKFTLTDCKDTAHKFSVNEDGLWVLDKNNGTETVTGGVITGGSPGVFVPDGSFTMYGGNIVGNNAGDYEGGGINANGGTVTIYGGSIRGNLAGYGAGICGSSSTSINLFGGMVSDNTAVYNGGGIYSNAPLADRPVCRVMGAPIIDYNKADGVENNVHLLAAPMGEAVAYSSNAPVINIVGELDVAAHIGVTAGADTAFTTGWIASMGSAYPAEYFYSDLPAYTVVKKEFLIEEKEQSVTELALATKESDAFAAVNIDPVNFGELTDGDTLPSLRGIVSLDVTAEEFGALHGENVRAEWVYVPAAKADEFNAGEDVFEVPEVGHTVNQVSTENPSGNLYCIKVTITAPLNFSDFGPLTFLNDEIHSCVFAGDSTPLRLTVEGGKITVIFVAVSGDNGEGGNPPAGDETYNVKLVQNLDNVSVEVVLFGADEYESGYLAENGDEGRGKYALVMISGENLDPSKITVKANNAVVALNVGSSMVEEGFLQYNLINLTQDTVITVSKGGSSNNNNSGSRPSTGGSTGGTITVPVSNDKNEVKVEASVSGNDATIKPMDKQQIEQIVGDNKAAGDVVVDLTELGKAVDTAGIPKASLEAIVEAAEDAKNDTAHLVIKLTTAELKLDDAAMRAIVDQAKGDIVKFNFDDVGLTRMNSKQKAAVKDMDIRKGYEAYITVNGQRIGDFKGGKVEITVPYEIPAGENKAGFSVWYIDENGKPEKQKSTYDGKEKCFVVTHFSDYVIVYNEDDAQAGSYMVCTKDAACPIHGYADANASAWYHDGVHYCIEHGIMNGYSTTSFKPNGAVTRQQVWMTLARLSGEDPANMAAARVWAMENGVSDGTNPTAAVTRQQFITMLWRYAKQMGYDVSSGEDTNILSYTDAFGISEYAIPALQWGCAEDIMGGYADGSLKPANGATRAHLAAFLQRFCEGIAR